MADKTFNLKVVGSLRDLKGLLDGSLTSFRIPDGVTSLDRDRFYNFMQLIDLDFNQVEVIPPETCRGCTNLANVTFTTHTTEIGEHAFRDCTHFEDTELPHTLTNIGSYAFQRVGSYYERGTHTFTMIDDIGIHTTIGSYAFSESHLSQINAYTNDIGPYAFQNCLSLTAVNLEIHGKLDAYAFYNCNYIQNFRIATDSIITALGESVFAYMATSMSSADYNISAFDFRKSSFASVPANVWRSNKYDGVVYFPPTVMNITGNFLNEARGNWMLCFTSKPTVSSSSYLRSDTAGTFTNKFCFPIELVNDVKLMTNWSTHSSQIYGWIDGVAAGDVIQPYTKTTGLAVDWYLDPEMTTQVTISTGPNVMYYGNIVGQTREVYYASSSTLDASITISDGTNIYTNFVPVGTSITITPSYTDPTINQLYLFLINGVDYTQAGSASIIPTEDLSIIAIYWDGVTVPIDPVLANNSWVQIKLASQLNIILPSWLGDTKQVTFDGLIYSARLIDTTGKYTYVSNDQPARFLFELTELLPTGSGSPSWGYGRHFDDRQSINYNEQNPIIPSIIEDVNNMTDLWETDLKAVLEPINIQYTQYGLKNGSYDCWTVPMQLTTFLPRGGDFVYQPQSRNNYAGVDEYYLGTANQYADAAVPVRKKWAKDHLGEDPRSYWCGDLYSSDSAVQVQYDGKMYNSSTSSSADRIYSEWKGVSLRFAL